MPEALLEIHDLSVHFPTGFAIPGRPQLELRAVDGVSLQVRKGTAVGLVGESGCGKSTLARTVVGLQAPTRGRIVFDGAELPRRRGRALHRRIQMVFQDPYSSLNPRMTTAQILAELLRVHHMVPRDRVDARVLELLELVGLPRSLRDAYPRQMSGGQRQRVGIARALALEPELLIADEPISALDVSVQASILNLLGQLREQLSLTLVFVAHNLAVVRHLCDEVAVMYLGTIVEQARGEELFSNPRHPYTQGLIEAIPRLDPDRSRTRPAVEAEPPSPFQIPEGCRFHPRCPIARRPDPCALKSPKLEPGQGGESHRAACHFAWSGEEAASR
jgi:oligopeptide/dipeptide ABC transporter ATP-binding protein